MTDERILIIRPSALGDVCRSVPVLTSLRRAYPSARIDWLVQAEFVDAIRAHPDLTNAIPFRRREMSIGHMHRAATRKALASLIRDLRTPRYTLVLDCQGLARSGLFTRLTGARARVGHAYARELAWIHYTQRVPLGASPHTVDQMLDLIRAIGIEPSIDMRLYAPSECENEVDKSITQGSPIVLAPTSRWPGKRWPIERFNDVTDWLLQNTAVPIAVVGSGSESEQCLQLTEKYKANPRVHNLLGRTTVGGLMHLISHSSLVVANDSAALHMAVGFDRPIVALFGPTDIAKVGPYRRDSCVLQARTPPQDISHKNENAGRQLMEGISVTQVIESVEAALAAHPGVTREVHRP